MERLVTCAARRTSKSLDSIVLRQKGLGTFARPLACTHFPQQSGRSFSPTQVRQAAFNGGEAANDLIAIDVGRSGPPFVVRLLYHFDHEPGLKVHDGNRRDDEKGNARDPGVGMACRDNAGDAHGPAFERHDLKGERADRPSPQNRSGSSPPRSFVVMTAPARKTGHVWTRYAGQRNFTAASSHSNAASLTNHLL